MIGVERDVEDGESTLRAEAGWRPSTHFSVGTTFQFWDGYSLMEPEVRWFPPVRRELAPVFGVSLPVQRTKVAEGLGFAVFTGLESYAFERLAVSIGLGWRSLFRRHREPGFLEPMTDAHWFRLRFRLSFLADY